jgi:hypothetical protein
MFPIAHAWLLEKLVPQPAPAHYLGCVWPDMLFSSPLSHTQSHRGGDALAAYARSLPSSLEGDEFRAFVAGVLTHGTEPHGFDWYSDEEYGGRPPAERGYAFQHAKPLASEAALACGLPQEQGWWKAHNLVEMAFESPLYHAQPHLGDRLAATCADETLHARIAALLAGHFAQSADSLALPMRRFAGVVELRPATVEQLARIYAVQVRLKHNGAVADVAALARLIERAQEDISSDRDAFLATGVAKVGTMLREVDPNPPAPKPR